MAAAAGAALPPLGAVPTAIVKGHRPFPPAIVDELLELHFTHGWSYVAIAKLPGMPRRHTWHAWPAYRIIWHPPQRMTIRHGCMRPCWLKQIKQSTNVSIAWVLRRGGRRSDEGKRRRRPHQATARMASHRKVSISLISSLVLSTQG